MTKHFRPRVTLTENRKEVTLWRQLINIIAKQGGIELFILKMRGIEQTERQYHKEETSYLSDGAKVLKIDSTKIRTVDELIQYHKIDTAIYTVTPVESTYWESGAKLPDGTIVTIPLHRLKVRIEPKKPDAAQILQTLIASLDNTKKHQVKVKENASGTGVVAIGDLHIGANVQQILLTPDFNIDILTNYIKQCAAIINSHKLKHVHIFILGDIIESFTGLNHKNTWQELSLYGIEAVKAAYKLLTDFFLNNICNLEKIYIVGGNHDRTSEKIELDMKGGAAGLIAFMLSENGYNCQYSPLLIDCTIDNIHYIATHGNYSISKVDAGQTLFKYGKQDKYNILLQAHKHTREGARALRYASGAKEYKTIHIDDINYRKLTIPPMITGNFYSQSLGLNSTAGFLLIHNSGTGKPIVHDYCL